MKTVLVKYEAQFRGYVQDGIGGNLNSEWNSLRTEKVFRNNRDESAGLDYEEELVIEISPWR
jgi:hypothetical protein